jgi:hypothetical protein
MDQQAIAPQAVQEFFASLNARPFQFPETMRKHRLQAEMFRALPEWLHAEWYEFRQMLVQATADLPAGKYRVYAHYDTSRNITGVAAQPDWVCCTPGSNWHKVGDWEVS